MGPIETALFEQGMACAAGASFNLTDVPAISELIREYIDTPMADLLSKQSTNDHWGLVNTLRAADRRIGQRQLPLLWRKIHNVAALKVLDMRQPAAVAKRQLAKVSDAKAPELMKGSSNDKIQYGRSDAES
jgi:hypothetical protein